MVLLGVASSCGKILDLAANEKLKQDLEGDGSFPFSSCY